MKLKYSARSHGYWLDGKRCKSPSAIAKVPDDSSALDYWRRRQTAIGLALQPHLLTAIAASADDKKALDAICEEAMAAAGANSGRDFGTAVHKITDLIDGGVFVLETPEVLAIRDAWRTLLESHDLEILASEQVIVHPELMIAGRFDRVVRHRATGECFILDTKTGKSAADFLQAHAVQLWLYASAPLCADGPSGDADFEVSEFVPMHRVSQSVALVAHLPMEGEPSIIGIDIAAGRRCFEEVIRPTWAWRARTDLRVDGWAAAAPSPRVANLLARLRTIAEMSPEMAQSVRASWPAGVPKLSDGGHTDDDLDRIEALVQRAETGVSAPFADLPAEPAPLRTITPRPAPVLRRPEIGAAVDDAEVAALRERYAAVDDAVRSQIGGWAADSRSNVSWHMADGATVRSVRIVSALLDIAEHDASSLTDEVVRSLVHLVTGEECALWPSLTVGAVVSMLDATEARRLQSAAAALIAGGLAAIFDDDGALRFADIPLDDDAIAARLGAQVA